MDEEVVISVADDRLDDMSTVVDALRDAGLTVTDVLVHAGVVTGTADGEALASLSAVPGVAEVERSRTVEQRRPDPGHV